MALNEGKYAEEFLLSELPGKISRDNVTVTVATTLAPGQVLGKITGGNYVAYDDTASDGRETAAAILLREAAVTGVYPVINFGAEVSEGGLAWGAADQPTGKADLLAKGIKVRSSVPAAALDLD